MPLGRPRRPTSRGVNGVESNDGLLEAATDCYEGEGVGFHAATFCDSLDGESSGAYISATRLPASAGLWFF